MIRVPRILLPVLAIAIAIACASAPPPGPPVKTAPQAGVATEQAASAGTVMLSGLPVLAGIQFLIGFFSFDLTSVPRIPLIRLLGMERKAAVSAAPRQVASG